MSISIEAEKIMIERFGNDNVISLATSENNIPSVRYVNAFYENGAFFVLTYALSNKMNQIKQNPVISIAADWFTASGIGENLGYFGSEQNKELAGKMKSKFSEWIDNGHNNFEDENTIILKLKLTRGVLFSNGTRYDIEF